MIRLGENQLECQLNAINVTKGNLLSKRSDLIRKEASGDAILIIDRALEELDVEEAKLLKILNKQGENEPLFNFGKVKIESTYRGPPISIDEVHKWCGTYRCKGGHTIIKLYKEGKKFKESYGRVYIQCKDFKGEFMEIDKDGSYMGEAIEEGEGIQSHPITATTPA
jgi:hypothetical protein